MINENMSNIQKITHDKNNNIKEEKEIASLVLLTKVKYL
jgi:hypothetical protein